MKQWVMERLNYANVTATLALFLALGGTSYALTLPRNSVGSKQIRARAVGASEIHSGAVRSSAVRTPPLQLRDLSLGARTSLRGATGAQGPAALAADRPGWTHLPRSVNSAGVPIRGNGKLSARGINEYIVEFDRPARATEWVRDRNAHARRRRNESPAAAGVTSPTTVSREGARWVARTYEAPPVAR